MAGEFEMSAPISFDLDKLLERSTASDILGDHDEHAEDVIRRMYDPTERKPLNPEQGVGDYISG